MVQSETVLDVADNSGGKQVRCIKVLGGSRRRYARVGSLIVCSVKQVDPRGNLKKGQVVRAVVVRTKGRICRRDGSTLLFTNNACVILGQKGELVSTRIFGPVPREVRECGYTKICSLASEVV